MSYFFITINLDIVKGKLLQIYLMDGISFYDQELELFVNVCFFGLVFAFHAVLL